MLLDKQHQLADQILLEALVYLDELLDHEEQESVNDS